MRPTNDPEARPPASFPAGAAPPPRHQVLASPVPRRAAPPNRGASPRVHRPQYALASRNTRATVSTRMRRSNHSDQFWT